MIELFDFDQGQRGRSFHRPWNSWARCRKAKPPPPGRGVCGVILLRLFEEPH
jgi:hypothetical protein